MELNLRKGVYFRPGEDPEAALSLRANKVINHPVGRLRLTKANIAPHEIPESRLIQMVSDPLMTHDVLFQPQTVELNGADHRLAIKQRIVVHGLGFNEENNLGGIAFDVQGIGRYDDALRRVIASRVIVEVKKLNGFENFRIWDEEGKTTIVDETGKPLVPHKNK